MLATTDFLTTQDAVTHLAQRSGVVMLVGATDSGKSTLALEVANAAIRGGRRAAILDTDLGQGEVGPPGTIGLVRPEAPVATLSELRPRILGFVGATSPHGHLLSLVQEVNRLVRHSERRADDLVLVDTSGLVAGRVAERLKLAKLSVLEPSTLVFLHAGRELERLAALLSNASGAEVLHVRRARDARVKSPVYRRLMRANRTRRHFEHARVHELDASRVRVLDAWVYTGVPVPARKLRFASEVLQTPVPYGEETADGIYLCVEGQGDRGRYSELREEFGRKRILLTPAHLFQNLLVGLLEPGGRLLDVGLLRGVNFERALFSVLTPARTVEDVSQMHIGRLQVRPDGKEIMHLRPGDL